MRESIFSNQRASVQSGEGQGNESRTVTRAGKGGGLPFDEEAKLVYGVVLSLRNMAKKLSGK